MNLTALNDTQLARLEVAHATIVMTLEQAGMTDTPYYAKQRAALEMITRMIQRRSVA